MTDRSVLSRWVMNMAVLPDSSGCAAAVSAIRASRSAISASAWAAMPRPWAFRLIIWRQSVDQGDPG